MNFSINFELQYHSTFTQYVPGRLGIWTQELLTGGDELTDSAVVVEYKVMSSTKSTKLWFNGEKSIDNSYCR